MPLSPSTITARASASLAATSAIRTGRPGALASVLTHSAPARVFP
jgi:hypothetical protein